MIQVEERLIQEVLKYLEMECSLEMKIIQEDIIDELKSLLPKEISSLQGVCITSKKIDGNTTRIVDNAIQILMRGNICIIEDHDKNMSYQLYKRVVERLYLEHFIRLSPSDKYKVSCQDNNYVIKSIIKDGNLHIL